MPDSSEVSPRSVHAIYLRLCLMALMWAGTFVVGRIVMGSLTPWAAATCRFGVASIMLLVVAWRLEGGLPRLSSRQVAVTFGLGLTGVFLYNAFFFGALTHMPASRTAVFVSLNPICVTLLAVLVLGDRPSPLKWLGIGIAMVGACVVISRGDMMTLLGDLSSAFGIGEALILGGIVSWAAYTILGQGALRDLSPVAATTYAALWGFAMLLAATLWLDPQGFAKALDPQLMIQIAYLAVFGTVIPFVWYYLGVQRIGSARAVVFTNLVPVFGVILGVVLLGERVHWSMIAGGLLVISGVSLTNRAS